MVYRLAFWMLALLLLAQPASACLWDRDTLDVEAKGLPDVVHAITGRFERNPPLYYQMRLQRVTAELAAHPERLTLYDDAGVACDRLRRNGEAVRWMEKKRAAMARFAASRDDRYRYHANLGTFLVHHWLRAGADRTRLSEVKAARAEIAEAIRINPDAHFGREKYQLGAMDWIIQRIQAGRAEDAAGRRQTGLGTYLLNAIVRADGGTSERRRERLDEAVHGLSGLVILGDAWESVDIFDALRLLLRLQRKSTVSLLAGRRTLELLDAGRHSFGSNIERKQLGDYAHYGIMGPGYTAVLNKYRELRAEAEAWHRKRTEFMLARLSAGRHPDTDPQFWDGYKEPRAPSLAPSWFEWVQIKASTPTHMFVGLMLLVLTVLGAGAAILKRIRCARESLEACAFDQPPK